MRTVSPNTWSDILDKNFSEQEIMYTIKSSKNKKATGPDLISYEMIKASAPILLQLFKKVFNYFT